MGDETRHRDLEQVLLPTEPAPQINAAPEVATTTVVAKFGVLQLCCAVLFSIQLGLMLIVERSKFFFLVAIPCFGLATIAMAVPFNRLQIGLTGEVENTATSSLWALKYLWEIKSNFVLYTFLVPFQVYLAIQHASLASSEDEINQKSVPIYNIAVVCMVLSWIYFLFVALVAHRFSRQLKLKQQPNEEQQLCVPHQIFTGFQIASKIWIFVTLYFFTDADIPQVSVALVLISRIFYLSCHKALKHLFWTPSPMIFNSIEIQSLVIDETMWFYVGMGFIVLCFQAKGILSKMYYDWRYTESFFVGLLLARMLHILLCVLMNAMAINIRKAKHGARYLVVDIIFSKLNLLFGIVTTLYMLSDGEIYYYYWRILILMAVNIKLGIFVVRIFQDIDAQIKHKRFSRDLRILSGCFAILAMMFIPSHIAAFWLINITAANGLYSFSTSAHLHVSTDEHDEGIRI